MFKKILLSAVAIATLTTASFGSCQKNDTDFTKLLPDYVKEYKEANPDKAWIVLKAEATAGSNVMNFRFGKISGNSLKNIGIGLNSEITYDQIIYNYNLFVLNLSNEDLKNLAAFLSSYPTEVLIEGLKEKQGYLKENTVDYRIITYFEYAYLKKEALEKGKYRLFDAMQYVYRFILQKEHNSETLNDKQLKDFNKAIISGNAKDALQIIRTAKIHYPSFVKRPEKKSKSSYIDTTDSKSGYPFYERQTTRAFVEQSECF